MYKPQGIDQDTDYRDFLDKYGPEVLRSALEAIDPDNMGMDRDQVLKLMGAMKNCGFSQSDFEQIMSKSGQNKGTFKKQWGRIRGDGAHGTATEGTIYEYALQSGWKWPDPRQFMSAVGEKKKKPKKRPALLSAAKEVPLVCSFDGVEYKEKPPRSAIWEIREREPIQGPVPESITLQSFAAAIVAGRSFYPCVYSKEITGKSDEGKPIYQYKAIEQQLFCVDIDNEDKKTKKRIEDPLTIQKALEICKQNEIAPTFIYESFSSKLHRDDPNEPYQKFRLCFVLDKPISAVEVGERGLLKARERLISLFGSAADTSTTDNGRLFFGTDEKDRAKLYSGAILDSNKFVAWVEKGTDQRQQDQDKKEPETAAVPDLKPITADELLHKEIAPLRFIVDGIIPAGLGFLAAPPKYYKSFLALQMCIAVSKGEEILGRKSYKTECLYFDLESGDRRPQNRLKAMWVDSCPGLHFVTQEQMPRVNHAMITLATGFDLMLENYLSQNKNIGLVIIDVFKKIRTPQQKNQTLYEHDYADIERLQALAAKYNVCVLMLHHTTKMKDPTDPFNSMGGSTGVLGAADFALIIDKDTRNAKQATLYTTGRDIEAEELAVEFDKVALQWRYKGTAEEVEAQKALDNYDKNPITETIRHMVETEGGTWAATTGDIKIASEYMPTAIHDKPEKIGKFIQENIEHFAVVDGINVGYSRTNKARKYVFSTSAVGGNKTDDK